VRRSATVQEEKEARKEIKKDLVETKIPNVIIMKSRKIYMQGA